MERYGNWDEPIPLAQPLPMAGVGKINLRLSLDARRLTLARSLAGAIE